MSMNCIVVCDCVVCDCVVCFVVSMLLVACFRLVFERMGSIFGIMGLKKRTIKMSLKCVVQFQYNPKKIES